MSTTTARAQPDAPLLACHECGLLQRLPPIGPRGRALCRCCGNTLRHRHVNSLARVVHLNLGALILFVLANAFPFLIFAFEGRQQVSVLASGVTRLWADGMVPLAIVVLAASILFPAVKLLASLYALAPLHWGFRLPGDVRAFRLVDHLRDWAMLDVLLLGVVVAYVKLTDLAQMHLGIGLMAFVGAMILEVAADTTLDRYEIWNRYGRQATEADLAAGSGPILSCHGCDQVVRQAGHDHRARCPRCGAALHRRKPESLARTWALTIAAACLFVPANLLPVMTIVTFGRGDPSTVMGGVILLIHHHMYPIAAIVFVASVLVPVLKLLGLALMLLSVQRRWRWRPLDRTRLFRIIELIGRWSMVDVFVVAILVALVSLGSLASIEPGIGMTAFAGTVILTMLASMSFDPRLIWDGTADDDAVRV